MDIITEINSRLPENRQLSQSADIETKPVYRHKFRRLSSVAIDRTLQEFYDRLYDVDTAELVPTYVSWDQLRQRL